MKTSIHVLGDNGYVWDADVAHWLRLECGLVGAMVGGVAAFKQQNAVHGLPLELSPEEVTLALERGWAQLQPALQTGESAAAAAAAAAAGGGRKRGREAPPNPYQYYEEEDEGELGGGDCSMQEAEAEAEAEEEPAWRDALASGAAFDIPTTPAEAAAASGAGGSAGAAGGGGAEAAAAAAEGGGVGVRWDFPATREERHRYWVFRDLHAKGYRLTGGSKFGSDFLVYPGDPTLYHAQFCVRLMAYDQPLLPAMLASATRGSHQARKHLLIASVEEEGQEEGMDAAARQAGVAAAAAAAAAGGAAPGGSSDAGGGGGCAAPPPAQQQAGQAPGGEQAAGPAAVGEGGGEGWQLGSSSCGSGSGGARFRVRYMTIGPVEGFG